MRNFVLLALVVILGGVLAWFLTRSAPQVEPISASSLTAATPTLAPPDSAPLPATPLTASVDDATSVGDDRQQIAATLKVEAMQVDAGPRSLVFGRVLDEQARALERVKLTLTSVGGAWAPGREVPKLTRDGREIEHFEQFTDSEGRFRFDVVTPTSDWISLNVEAGEYFGRVALHFGLAGGRNQPRLVEGENDLGDVSVPIAGALAGSVLDKSGQPIAKGRVSLDGIYPGGHGVSTTTKSDGSYLLGGAPQGVVKVKASAEGFLSATADEVEVRNRETLPVPTFQLERAPTILGTVVDATGAPLDKVRVWGWPSTSGQGAGGRTDASGRFTIYLPQAEPYHLEVTNNEQFLDWGGRTGEHTFAPGTSDVRVVLQRRINTLFRVVDAQSGAPLSRFGLDLMTRELYEHRNPFHRLKVSDQPSGDQSRGATPGEYYVGVLAPDHAPFEALVEHDAGAPGVQTIRMLPEAVLRGRVEYGGAPLARASVKLERHQLPFADLTVADADEEALVEVSSNELGVLAGRPQIDATRADGSFEFGELASGKYQITITGGSGARLTKRGLVVQAAGVLDVGVLALEPGATLRARVLLPDGVSAAGLNYIVDHEWSLDARIANTDGTFELKNLAPGKHKLALPPSPPTLLHMQEVEFEIAAGETKDLQIDLRNKQPCTVSVRVVSAGRPLANLKVDWHKAVDSGAQHSFRLGNARDTLTDTEGFARLQCEGGQEVFFSAATAAGMELGRTKPELVASGGRHETVLEISVGELVVILPDTFALPERGSAGVFLADPTGGGDFPTRLFTATFTTAASPFRMGVTWSSRTLDVGLVAAGKYIMTVNAYHLRPDPANKNGGEHDELMPAYTTEVTIEPGKRTEVRVPKK